MRLTEYVKRARTKSAICPFLDLAKTERPKYLGSHSSTIEHQDFPGLADTQFPMILPSFLSNTRALTQTPQT
jgi:hypothetical protein